MLAESAVNPPLHTAAGERYGLGTQLRRESVESKCDRTPSWPLGENEQPPARQLVPDDPTEGCCFCRPAATYMEYVRGVVYVHADHAP